MKNMENSLDCHYSGLPSPKAYDMENKQPFEFNNDTNVGFINPFTNTLIDIGGQTKTSIDWLLSKLKEYVNPVASNSDSYSIRIPKSDMVDIVIKSKSMYDTELMAKFGEGYNEGLWDADNK